MVQAVQLVPATQDQQPTLANLLELYIHDFSEFLDLQIGPDGRFGYPNLPLYFSEPNRHPFFVMIGAKPAGFVFVKQGSELSGNKSAWDMVEFFVLRGYRRRGIGTQIASHAFNRFPGPWEVRVMQSNLSALKFWSRAIADFTGHAVRPLTYERAGQSWQLFAFQSGI